VYVPVRHDREMTDVTGYLKCTISLDSVPMYRVKKGSGMNQEGNEFELHVEIQRVNVLSGFQQSGSLRFHYQTGMT